jgi:hypothetical protein
MTQTRTYFDLLDAFGQEGCPVCRLLLAGVQHSFDSLNYDGVNDLGFRQQTHAAHGFCNRHAYQWLRSAHILSTTLIYDQVLVDTIETLGRIRFRKTSLLARIVSRWRGHGSRIKTDALMPRGICPICTLLAEQERALISTLAETLHEAAFRQAYTQSAGLCLPHLRRALDASADAAAFSTLRDVAIHDQERLHEQLREIIRKHDYRYRNEPSGEEVGAAARAVAQIAAAQGITQ